MPELHAQYPGLDRIEPSVVSFDIVVILLSLAVVADHAALAGNFFIVGGYGAGLAASTQVFARIEAESARGPDRSGLFPAFCAFGVIFGPMRLAGVFDHD